MTEFEKISDHLFMAKYFKKDQDFYILWGKILKNKSYLDEAVSVEKNKIWMNSIKSVIISEMILKWHKKVPKEIVDKLLKNIFTTCVYCFGGDETKLYETRGEQLRIQSDTPYLMCILREIDLLLDDEYQNIICDHIVKNNGIVDIDIIALFLLRGDIKDQYKEKVFEILPIDKNISIYNIHMEYIEEILKYKFDLKLEEFFKTPDLLTSRIENENKDWHLIIEKELKFIKTLKEKRSDNQ